MAKLAKRHSFPRRSSASRTAAVAKFKHRAALARARVGGAARQRKGMLLGAVGAALLGYAEKSGMALPTVGGVAPSLLYGGIAVFVGPLLVKGNAGKMVEHLGSGMLDVAAYKLASGQPMLSGEYDDVAGDGWTSDTP